MTISTQTYEDIYDQYTSAIKWMSGLGVKLNQGRTSHYEKIIKYWKDEYKTATEEEGQKIYPDFVSSMYEVFDFVNVFTAFNDVDPNHLRSIVEKLQKGVNGPINIVDETSDSTTARNFLFEAALAAKVHRPDNGIEAILDAKSDTGIRLDGKKLWIECKRVTNVDKIESNARKASSQLEAILAGQVGSGHRGIVAMDISKILNKGDKIFATQNDDELLKSVDIMMDKFIDEHSHIWQRVYERRHKKIIGTIIRFSFMASSESRNLLVHTSQWAMNPRLGIATGDSEIQRQLVTALVSVR
jgi:hypothetical protein